MLKMEVVGRIAGCSCQTKLTLWYLTLKRAFRLRPAFHFSLDRKVSTACQPRGLVRVGAYIADMEPCLRLEVTRDRVLEAASVSFLMCPMRS